MIILLFGFLFSCASNVELSKEEMLTGSWDYVTEKDEPIEAQLYLRADQTYQYDAVASGENFVQNGTWKLTEHGEIEIFLEEVIRNGAKKIKVNKNAYINILSLTNGQMILQFGTDREYKQKFHRID